jgi:hypothetical protein
VVKIDRRDYGLKVAMPGYDVQTAPDNKLLFNSSFPILQAKILAILGINAQHTLPGALHTANFGGEFLEAKNTGFSTIYKFRWRHELGYVPFMMPIDPSYFGSGSPWYVDEQYIYYINSVPPFYNTTTGERNPINLIFCSPTPVTDDIEYPYIATPLSFSKEHIAYLHDYGIKTSRYGFIEKNKELAFGDAGIDLRLQPQMILGVKTNKEFGNKAGDITYWVPNTLDMTDVTPYGFVQSKIDIGNGNTVMAWSMIANSDQKKWITMDVGTRSYKLTYGADDPSAARALVAVRSPMVSPSSDTIYI